jgi:hypothetical protein
MSENAGFPIATFRCETDFRMTASLLGHFAVVFPSNYAYGERAILADAPCENDVWPLFA